MSSESLIRFFVSFAILLSLSSAPAAQSRDSEAGRALTIEDYYRIQEIGTLRISPSGDWIAYSVETRIEEDNSTQTEVYVVSTRDPDRSRRILHYGRDVREPEFTPGGKLQYRAGGLWKIDPTRPGSPPVEVPETPDRLDSPDGKRQVWLVEREKTDEEPSSASDFERRHQERFEGAIFDWKDFQRDGQPFPSPDMTALPAQHILLRSLPDGQPSRLVEMDLRPRNLAWHPNGRLLLFIADPDWRNDLTYDRSDLWTVSIEGEIDRLTNDLYVYRNADFSPDGTYISYLRTFGTDMILQQKLDHGGPRDLYTRPVEGGEPVNLTADWDLDPRDPRWSPDGAFLYFTANIGGAVHLFRVSVPAGRVEQVTQGERRIQNLVFDEDFQTMAYLVGRHEAPEEAHVAKIDGSGERQLTHVHAPILSEINISEAERLTWPSYDGTEIEGWLLYPHGYDADGGPYPLIVFSHGGPHSATGYRFDFKKQLFAANGYFILDTNFRSSTGYGDDFKWATWGAWGDKDGQDVMSGIDFVLERYPIYPDRVGHTGHSYGGFMTNWLITQYPDRFAAAISGAGISNWVSDYGTADIYRTKETEFFGPPWDEAARKRLIRQSPLTHAGRVETPTLFIHGEVDQRVPYPEGEQMYFALKRQGIPAKMIRYADQAHGIRGHWNNVHRMINELRWWERFLK